MRERNKEHRRSNWQLPNEDYHTLNLSTWEIYASFCVAEAPAQIQFNLQSYNILYGSIIVGAKDQQNVTIWK